MQPNQPIQNQPATAPQPAPPSPAQPVPVPLGQPQPVQVPPPVQPVMPQPISPIQAPSQIQLQPATNSLTTPGPAAMVASAATIQPTQPVPTQPQPQPLPQPVPQARPPQARPIAPQPQARPPQPAAKPAPPPKLTKEQQEKLNSTQNSLLISEIRENMVILNDGSFRAVVACESINYDLMSNEEREGIEFSYQNFLNTLHFPVQIVIQSRRIDIKPYLDRLEQIRAKQDNMLLGILMDDYLDFIFDISEQANIMRKDFFIVVPYVIGGESSSDVNNLRNMTDSVLSTVQKKQRIKIDAKSYDKAKDEIKNRVSTVLNGLMNIGVRAGQLPTKALSELYYNFYNPDTAINEPIVDLPSHVDALYIKKGEGEAPNFRQGVI